MELIDIPNNLSDEKAVEYCKNNNIDPKQVRGYPYIFGRFVS